MRVVSGWVESTFQVTVTLPFFPKQLGLWLKRAKEYLIINNCNSVNISISNRFASLTAQVEI